MSHAIYIRTSTSDQEPSLQLRDIRTILPEGAEPVVFSEQVSAYKDSIERPQFSKLLSEIKAGKVSDLYVFDLDRLYRNMAKTKAFFEFCHAYKCRIHSFNQRFLDELHKVPAPWDTIIKDLFVSLMGWMGESESRKKSARVKMAVRRVNGKTLSYNGNRWGRRPLPRQTVNRVLELHRQGHSVRQIAEMVMTTDRNKNQNNVSKSVVHKIIRQHGVVNGSILVGG